MTHTPGFEEAVKELITDDPSRLVSIGESVKRWIPNRIFKAGTMPAYSNYATALAGYIAYDYGRRLEPQAKIPDLAPDPADTRSRWRWPPSRDVRPRRGST